MSKVTSKLQVTVPKAIADEYRIRPGDEILWVAGGDSIHVVPKGRRPSTRSVEERMASFEQATARIRNRARRRAQHARPTTRGWIRTDLYDLQRGRRYGTVTVVDPFVD